MDNRERVLPCEESTHVVSDDRRKMIGFPGGYIVGCASCFGALFVFFGGLAMFDFDRHCVRLVEWFKVALDFHLNDTRKSIALFCHHELPDGVRGDDERMFEVQLLVVMDDWIFYVLRESTKCI